MEIGDEIEIESQIENGIEIEKKNDADQTRTGEGIIYSNVWQTITMATMRPHVLANKFHSLNSFRSFHLYDINNSNLDH
jgi:hypothetical protein